LRAGVSEQQILGHFSRRRDCIFPKCTLTAGKYDAAQPREWRTTPCAHVHSRTRAHTWGIHSHRGVYLLLSNNTAGSDAGSVAESICQLIFPLNHSPWSDCYSCTYYGLGADPLADLPFPHTLLGERNVRFRAAITARPSVANEKRVRGVGCTKGSGIRCPLPRN